MARPMKFWSVTIEILASGLTPFSNLPEAGAQPAIGKQLLESKG
jgi:hypothetical protein